MRLLNTTTLKLQEFFQPPPYVVLSHRWSDEEVSYEDYVLARRNPEQLPPYLVDEAAEIRERKGYHKVLDFAAQAGQHVHWETGKPFEWCWLDTCCIDKRSSSELSEAINSMWKWYKNSGFCVVYLEDVLYSDDATECGDRLKLCTWFGRCWTLQELLAPQKLSFFDSYWSALLSVYKGANQEDGNHWCWWSKDGTSAAKALESAARIPEGVLARGRLDDAEICVAQKMSWAAHRSATREEDVAYSLLGLFGINMPLLYGEGNRAFLRLQHEILRHVDDSSIFAWQFASDEPAPTPSACPHYLCESTSLLASSPLLFQHSGVLRKDVQSAFRIHITNSAVYMDVEAPVRRVVHTMDKIRRISPRIPWYVLELGYYIEHEDSIPRSVPCRLVIWRDTTNEAASETNMAGRLSCCTSAFETIDLGGRQEELTDSILRVMRFRVPIGYDDDQLDSLTTKSRQLGCANAKAAMQELEEEQSMAARPAEQVYDAAAIVENAPSVSSLFTVSARSVDISALQATAMDETAARRPPRPSNRSPRRSVTAIERLRGLVGIGSKRIG